MTASEAGFPERGTYRHGDLRRALVEAGTEMAREGGPGAVVLREATRRAGVAPSAAYRHFEDRGALLDAVCSAAQSSLAMTIEAELAELSLHGEPAHLARARLRAVGTGYLRFAREEPGLFRTAFSASENLRRAASPARAGEGGLTPFQLLEAALDGLVEAGVCRTSAVPERSSWRGRRCTGWRCCSSTARCGAWRVPRRTMSDSA